MNAQERRLEGFREFVRFGQRSTLASALVLLVVWLTLAPSPWMLGMVPFVLARSLFWTPVQRAIDRNAIDTAVLLMAVGEWALAVVITVGLPFASIVMVLSLVGPLLFGASLASRRVVAALTVGSVTVASLIAFLGVWDRLRQANDIPDVVDETWIEFGVVLSVALQMAPLAILAVQSNRIEQQNIDELLSMNRELDVTRTEVQEAVDELRNLARGLYPPLLREHGLVAALRAAGRHAALPVTVTGSDAVRYTPEVEQALYFCALEAMQNAAKHAGPAATVRVKLADLGDSLLLEVADDGRGFRPTEVDSRSGLVNMADRLGSVGGIVEVQSAPGKGTAITAQVAFSPAKQAAVGHMA